MAKSNTLAAGVGTGAGHVTRHEFEKRIAHVEERIDGMDDKLDVLLSRTTAQEATKGRIETRTLITAGGFTVACITTLWALAIAPYSQSISSLSTNVAAMDKKLDRVPLLIEEMEGQINTQDVVRNLEWQHHLATHALLGDVMPDRDYWPHIARPKSMMDANE